MPLPMTETPTYELKIPSTGQEITVRPFLVKEEKLLLIALESKDDIEIINTTKQIIKNCILTEGIDLDKLPFFDVDYIFIALRAKSVGENIEVNFICNNTLEDDSICNNTFKADIDISNCEIRKNEEITPDINLSGTLKVKMKYPNYAAMKQLSENEDNFSKKIRLIVNCIDRIIDKDKIYTSKDFTPLEAKAFVEGLTEQQYKKLENFVNNFPSFFVNAEATCEKCGFNHNIKYDNFASFFF